MIRTALRYKLRSWFSPPWRVVPAQPILYLFLWIAGIHVIATTGNDEIGFVQAGMSESVYYAWNLLIIIGPAMVLLSWLLIRFSGGHGRVWGLWLRLGGDTAVLAALIALIFTRIAVLNDAGPLGDSPLFALTSLAGVAVFFLALVVRDIGAIAVLEIVAGRIRQEEGGG